MKKKYGILSVVFLLLALLGAVFLVKNEQDNRNRATGGCDGSLSASACKTVNPGDSCTGGFDGTCKRTTDNNCACVANSPTSGAPTIKPPQNCTEGNLGILCCNSNKVACQKHRNTDCSTTCTDNCGIFDNSVCNVPTGIVTTPIPSGGNNDVTWDCNAMSGTRGGYNCSGYQSCSGNRSGTPCAPGEYAGGGIQAPVDAKSCQCSNGVWVIGKGATCDGLCACTNNVCLECTPTPKPPTKSTPTLKPTNTPTPRSTPKPTSTPRPTNTPIPTLTPTPTTGPSPTPTSTSTPTPTPTSIPNVCGGTCGSNSNCQSDYVCYQGYCRNPSCTNSADCLCPGEANLCGGTCGSNTNCKSNLFCNNGFCRNSSCPNEANCICQQSSIPTNSPIPTDVIAQGPSPTRIILPQSGVEFPSQMLTIIGGIITLLGFLILL